MGDGETRRAGPARRDLFHPIARFPTHPFFSPAEIDLNLLATQLAQFFGKQLRRVAVGAGAVDDDDVIF